MGGSIGTSRQSTLRDVTAESMSRRTRQPNSNNHEWTESVEDSHPELLRQVDISESGTGRAAEVECGVTGKSVVTSEEPAAVSEVGRSMHLILHLELL